MITYIQVLQNHRINAKLSNQYIRWYTKLKDTEFFWSDEVFKTLTNEWVHPSFLPNNSLLIPYTEDGSCKDINKSRYPYKGLFISGKGARTRLHRDPFNSNAVLCQLYGQKKIFMYDPGQANYVITDDTFVDIKNPDTHKFPDFYKATCSYEDILSPGELIFFPAGWFHDVTCLTDSVSITWNFVHAKELDGFCSYIEKHPQDDQNDVIRFFLRKWIKENASVYEIVSFFKSKFPHDI